MGDTLDLALQADNVIKKFESSPNINRALKNTATVGNVAMNAVIGTAITALFATKNMTLNDTVNEMAQAAISTAAYSALGKGMSMPAMFAQTLRNIEQSETFTREQKDRQVTSAFIGMIASNSLGEMASDAVQRSFDRVAMNANMDMKTRLRSQKATTLLGIAADTIVSSVVSAGANLLLQVGQKATQSIANRIGTGELESTYSANRQTSRALQQAMAEAQAEYYQRKAYERAMQVNSDEFEVAVAAAQNSVTVYDSQGQITQVFDINAGGRQGLDDYREKALGSEFAYANNENNYQATMIFQEAAMGDMGYEYPISEAEYTSMGFDMQGNSVYEIDASYTG